MEPEFEIATLMNNILNKTVQAQKMQLSAKAKDDIKQMCAESFDFVVKETAPMTIARLQYAANMKRKD